MIGGLWSGRSPRLVAVLAGLAIAAIAVLLGAPASGLATGSLPGDPCSPEPPTLSLDALTTHGHTAVFKSQVNVDGAQLVGNNWVDNCKAVIEMTSVNGTVYNFPFPSTNGQSKAYRQKFAAPDLCKLARVQKANLGRAVRRTQCVTQLLTVNVTSAYARAHRHVEDSCTGFVALARKSSKTARAKRETLTVSILARLNPSSPDLLQSQEGDLQMRIQVSGETLFDSSVTKSEIIQCSK
jgi:hypothetical protein